MISMFGVRSKTPLRTKASGNLGRDYKYLSWVYGVDRKSVTRVTDRHHEACRVMPNCDPE